MRAPRCGLIGPPSPVVLALPCFFFALCFFLWWWLCFFFAFVLLVLGLGVAGAGEGGAGRRGFGRGRRGGAVAGFGAFAGDRRERRVLGGDAAFDPGVIDVLQFVFVLADQACG